MHDTSPSVIYLECHPTLDMGDIESDTTGSSAEDWFAEDKRYFAGRRKSAAPLVRRRAGLHGFHLWLPDDRWLNRHGDSERIGANAVRLASMHH